MMLEVVVTERLTRTLAAEDRAASPPVVVA
jgi:hypothetical protein